MCSVMLLFVSEVMIITDCLSVCLCVCVCVCVCACVCVRTPSTHQMLLTSERQTDAKVIGSVRCNQQHVRLESHPTEFDGGGGGKRA